MYGFRIGLFVLFIFSGHSALADNYFSDYRGQLFPKEEQAQCQAAYSEVRQNMESQGLTVMAGACKEFVSGLQRVEITYHHSFRDRLDRYTVRPLNNDTCSDEIREAVSQFKQVGFRMVAHYCNRGEMVFDFVSNWERVIRETKYLATYTSLSGCEASLEDFETSFQQHDIAILIGNCISSIEEEETKYYPSLVYAPGLSVSVQMLIGERASRDLDCRLDVDTIAENMAQANRQLIFAGCLPSSKGEFREVIFYLSDVYNLTKQFDGQHHDSRNACYLGLEQTVEKLASFGEWVLFPYCERSGEKYIERVVYASPIYVASRPETEDEQKNKPEIRRT